MNVYSRANTAKFTLEMLKSKKQLKLRELYHWLHNSPNLNSVDFGILRLFNQNVHGGRKNKQSESFERNHC